MTRPFRDVVGAIRGYAAHPDPLVAAGNFIALLVASNQPFYPLYLYWLVSEHIEPSYFTFLSTPFFLAVPAISRIDTRAGRALLPLAGIGNTLMCAKLFGVASAVEVFLIPCGVLALLLFRPTERLMAFLIAAACIVAFSLLHGRYGAPIHVYSTQEMTALVKLNAVSAGMLTACAALIFSNLLAAATRPH